MFNTLKYAKMLEEVGFSRVQAETSIKILAETMEDKLATKQDLKDLGTRMTLADGKLASTLESSVAQLNAKIDSSVAQIDGKIARLDLKIDHVAAQLESKMDRLESKLTVRLGLMFATGITVLTALQKLTGIH